MQKKFVLIGGIMNLLFTLFHVYLTVALYRLRGLPRDIHALLVMLAVGGTLFILFFSIAFLRHAQEVLTTRLGTLALLFCFLLYATRALEEIVLASHFSIVIFIACAATALIFLFSALSSRLHTSS